jgi:hypothetical protein
MSFLISLLDFRITPISFETEPVSVAASDIFREVSFVTLLCSSTAEEIT